MKICLVRIPSDFLMEDKSFPPLGLMAVATCLRLRGHQAIVYDGPLAHVPGGYDGYGFGPTTPEYTAALETKERIREHNPGTRMVLGGTFAAINRERVASDGWDCIVIGDGEEVAERAFTGTESVVVAPIRPLDSYPIIDRTVLNLSRYRYFLRDRRATTMVTSRGCPWKCGFCCKTEQNSGVRLRSAAHVIQEIDYLYHDCGYRAIAIPDDIAIINRVRMERIARHFGRLGIYWRTLVRADLIVKFGHDFVRLMADTGCINVGMGIETGSDRILGIVDKRENIDTIKRAIRMLNSAGITVKGYFIVGLPGETRESLCETEDFLDEMQLADVDIKIYQPYPGSPIFERKEQYDIQWDDVLLKHQYYKGRIGDYHSSVSTSALSNAELVQAMNHLEGRFKRVGL